MWYEGSGTSDRRWLLADPLGSVVAVTNAAGTATAINAYDEYGQPGPSNAGRFQYAGALALPEAGLLAMRARAYDPALGRFLQTDPILTEGGINLYAYVGNDPINATDPSGLGDPFLDEIIVHGYRWYEDPNFQARRDQLNAQQMTRDLQGVGGSASGETSDPKSDIITVIGQRPGPAIVGAPPPVLYAGGTQTTQQYLQCVADTANTGGLAGAAIAGAAAIAAGTRIIPYSAVAGRSGLNPAGRTSIISAASRGFFRGTLGPGPVNDALASIAGTRSVGGVVGRLTARTSVGIGIVLESYSAGRVIGGALRCMQ